MNDRNVVLRKILEQAGYVLAENNGVVEPMISDELDVLPRVLAFEAITKQIIARSVPIFSARMDRKKQGLILHYGRLGTDALRLLSLPNKDMILKHFPRHDLTPYFDLVWKMAEKSEVLNQPLTLLPLGVGLEDYRVRNMADCLNKWCEEIQKKGQSQQFREKIDNYRRAARKTAQGLKSYQRRILHRHPTLEVVRLDLTYRKPGLLELEPPAPMTFDEITSHRKALVKFLQKSSISKYLLGFAWKLSYALLRGFNIHLLLLLKRSDDHAFGSIVGGHWNKTITKGRGIYFDCIKFGAGYRSSGFISHNVTAMAWQFDNVALFMTWPDLLVKLRVPKNGRSFGKGQIKGDRSKGKKTRSPQIQSNLIRELKKLTPRLLRKKTV